MVEKRAVFRAFRRSGALTKAYLRVKFIICPLLDIEPHVPARGHIVDLGCGNGLFAAVLTLGSAGRRITALDLDRRKLEVGRKLKIENGWKQLDFQEADIAAASYPKADAFTLIDVLYLIPFGVQEDILLRCAQSLRSGGVLVIKEMDTRPRWKYAWNFLQETFSVKVVGFTLGGRFYFRPRRSYLDLLASLGFKASVIEMDRGQVHPHILYVATKR